MTTPAQTQTKAKPAAKSASVTNHAQTGLVLRKCACGESAGLDGECTECREKKLTVQRRAINGAQPPSVPSSPGQPSNPGSSIQKGAGAAHNFSRIRVSAAVPERMQTKLTVNEPGDKYEQEADQVAEQVMRMATTEGLHKGGSAGQAQNFHIQRLPSEGEKMHRQEDVEETENEDEEESLQAKEVSGEQPEVTPELQTNINSIRGDGQPLPEPLRAFMEPRFGYDFSQVHIHTDTRAAETAQAVKAKAYTLGRDIVFGAGQYVPGTTAGKELLAHELTHVVQQNTGTKVLSMTGPKTKRTEEASEQLRNRFVDQTMRVQLSPYVRQTHSIMLQRQVDPEGVKKTLASVQVEQNTEKELLLRPAKIFELVPKNTPQKRDAYNRVQKALKKLRKATEATTSSSHKTKSLNKAKTDYEEAQKELRTAIESLKAFVKAHVEKGKEEPGKTGQTEEWTAPIEGDIYGPSLTERTYYTITVDGERISLYDHVEAYATVFEKGLEGKASSESKEAVRSVLEKSALSDSRKKILKTISTSEGGFTSVNTWDKAVLTWGMVQWTGGDKSDLTAALTIIKKVAPEAFKNRFQKYGIDVEGNKLAIVSKEGPVSRGSEAAKAVGASPILTAVMSRAGLDPEIQMAELKAAAGLEIDRPLNKELRIEVPYELKPEAGGTGRETGKGKKQKKAAKTFVAVRLGDIFTSEYGVGVLADQVVHGGFPSKALTKALSKFLKEHKFDPREHTKWAADAEKALIPIVAKWPDRAKALEKNGCSKDSGTFR